MNNTTELARQTHTVPPSKINLLDRLLNERTEYSYWMSRKSTDDMAKIPNDKHEYYISILKDVKIILTERVDPNAEIVSHTEPPTPVESTKITNKSNQQKDLTLGKRKTSSPALQDSDRATAPKTEIATTNQQQDLRNENNHSATVQIKRQDEWRQAITDSCHRTIEMKRSVVARPMSYAAALGGAIIA